MASVAVSRAVVNFRTSGSVPTGAPARRPISNLRRSRESYILVLVYRLPGRSQAVLAALAPWRLRRVKRKELAFPARHVKARIWELIAPCWSTETVGDNLDTQSALMWWQNTGRSENPQTTADHRRPHRRPPQDSTGHTAEHCRTRKIILLHFRRGSMLK